MAIGVNSVLHGFVSGLRDRLQMRTVRRTLAASPLFDAEWYRRFYPEAAAGGDPLGHYLSSGAARRLHPSLHFDADAYLDRYPDVLASGLNPLYHYLRFGRAEGRTISRPIDRPDFFDHLASDRWIGELRSDRAWAEVATRQPLVSIILPTKDRAAVLPRAIRSVLDQTWRHWELLVIDDASHDDTSGIVRREFGDPRIRLLPSSGIGVCDARNTGLAEARGGFIAYLDSDNTWTREYLELMLAELARSGADAAYAVLEAVDAGDTSRPPATRYIQQQFSRQMLLAWNFIDINVFMHRRALYEERGGFDRTLRRVVDWDLILRYSAQRRVSFANFIGAVYDDGPCQTRVSNRESVAYVNVVRNRHLIDWGALRRGASDRDADLVSVVVVAAPPAASHRRCLESLARHDAGVPFETIIASMADAGGHVRRSLEDAAATPSTRLVPVPESCGFSLAANIGCAESRGSRVVFLADGTDLFPGWLRCVLESPEAGADAALPVQWRGDHGGERCVGIVFSQRSPPGRRIHLLRPEASLPNRRSPDYVELQPPCIVVRAEDFIRAGGFDPLLINGPGDIGCFGPAGRAGEMCARGAAASDG